MAAHQHIIHPIRPVYNECSSVLILGSFPSQRSREQMFFYGHPQNRFWRVLASIYGSAVPQTVEEKRDFLLSHGVAVWDVIASCEIVGSADSTIRRVIPNDLGEILAAADIRTIYVNGKTAERYYNRYIRDAIGRDAVCLPSTSPANAAWSFDRLVDAWRVITNKK